MRLTAFLMHWKNKRPHGHKYRGKHRIVLEPKVETLLKMTEDFEREERNMLILRHPYLTVEQSRNHMADLRPHISWKDVGNEEKNMKFNKRYTWVDQLRHLRVTDAWE